MQDSIITGIEEFSSSHPHADSIIQILNEQARGWNEGNAEMYANAFSEDGSFTNIFGMFFKGHQTFFQKHDMILKNVFKNSRFEYKLVHLQFPVDEVAVVETLITVSAFNKSGSFNLIHTDKEGRMFTRLVQVMVKKINSWKIISYHNLDIKEGIAIPELV
ncbi:SgcJ/EcaC family oxidoreductase [Lacibacter sp. H407]|uniref:SgcJ/EcaC family oxidoreductase n=1 Tax=Lacibacter sp. H407 TaxID=3133423 RepID=UPI0030BF8A1F